MAQQQAIKGLSLENNKEIEYLISPFTWANKDINQGAVTLSTIPVNDESAPKAFGKYSLSLGPYNTVGKENQTLGISSVALGAHNTIEGNYSFAANTNNFIAGVNCTVFGSYNRIPSNIENTFIAGRGVVANQSNSAVFGLHTVTSDQDQGPQCQLIGGQYNVATQEALFIIGNGTGDASRHNAFQINEDGSIRFQEYSESLSEQDMWLKIKEYIQTTSLQSSKHLSIFFAKVNKLEGTLASFEQIDDEAQERSILVELDSYNIDNDKYFGVVKLYTPEHNYIRKYNPNSNDWMPIEIINQVFIDTQGYLVIGLNSLVEEE